MKKILLALCLSPIAAWAQTGTLPLLHPGEVKAVEISPVTQDRSLPLVPVTAPQPKPVVHNKTTMQYDLGTEQIGFTYYDLQTNGAMPRRLQLYPDGELSAVWTFNPNETSTFPDRGTSYNHFDGSSWIGNNLTRYEPRRAGWPNLVHVNQGGTEKEMIISHFASGDVLSGGLFWMINSQVGNPTFTLKDSLEIDNGPLWPRAAAAGNYVHTIAVYNNNTVQAGVKNPIVYSRFNVTGDSFEVYNTVLPDYDNTRYYQGASDQYSIDARDSFVAILLGGSLDDLTLWKSSDYGHTWTRSIIDSFPIPHVNIKTDEFDVTWSNDGSVNVTLDNNGVAHVFYARTRVENLDIIDTFYKYIPLTDGINYWNDKDQVLQQAIAFTPDFSGDQTLDIRPNTTVTDQSGASYGGTGLSTFPIGAVDADNNIYLVYSAINEVDITDDQLTNYRDVFVIYSTDGGQTWSNPQDLTAGVPQKEDVFATVARDVDDDLHIMWMQDDLPGIYLVTENPNSIQRNSIMYAAIPKDDILQNKIGLYNVGIEEANNVFDLNKIYPNPASSQLTIPVNMQRSAQTSVRIVDVVGKTVSEKNFGMLPAGNSQLSMDISKLSAGVYFCQVNAGGYTTSQKLIVE